MKVRSIAFLMLSILMIPFFVKGQLKLETLSYKASVHKAFKTGKLLFVYIPPPNCVVCKDITIKNFSDAALSKKISQQFVAISLSEKDTFYVQLTNYFDRVNSGGVLFIDSKENLLHKLPYGNLTVKDYMIASDKAISNKSRTDSLEPLTKAYEEGNREIAFLEKYIDSRQELGLNTDKLLDEYTSLIPKDSLMSSYRINSFIQEHLSIVYSKADDACHTSRSTYKEVWYKTDRNLRASWNKRMRTKSMAKAIKEKDDAYALRVIRAFSEGNTVNKSKQAQKNYLLYCADYYWAVKDTVAYLYNAKNYIDQFINNISVDSINNLDKRLKEKQNTKSDSLLNDTPEVSTQTFAKFYSSTLNQFAWNFYKVAQKSDDIRKASYWSFKSVELNPEEGLFWDTYARILYKQGDKIKAIDAERKAIELISKKEYVYTTKEFEKVLKNMQDNKVEID